jgi:hypothetical protein
MTGRRFFQETFYCLRISIVNFRGILKPGVGACFGQSCSGQWWLLFLARLESAAMVIVSAGVAVNRLASRDVVNTSL